MINRLKRLELFL